MVSVIAFIFAFLFVFHVATINTPESRKINSSQFNNVTCLIYLSVWVLQD
ncbi:hypothetical protein Scep_000924 [Stephania cephalantha]|uniref:Uncharacterized protein n=1 Tax=Stephania cephalantha TaxID=152367 RepID=A0AAP0L716_9MAGN